MKMASSLKYYAAYSMAMMTTTTRKVSSYIHPQQQHISRSFLLPSLPTSSASPPIAASLRVIRNNPSSFSTAVIETHSTRSRSATTNSFRLYHSSTTTSTSHTASKPVGVALTKQAKQSKQEKRRSSGSGPAGLYSTANRTNKQKRTFNNSKKKQLLKKQQQKTAAATIEPLHYGPLGRTALTESKLQELLLTSSSLSSSTTPTLESETTTTTSTLYGGGLSNMEVLVGSGTIGTTSRTPKMVLMEAQAQLDFATPQFRIEDYTQDGIPTMQHGNNLHKVTCVSIIHDDILPSSLYEKMKKHSHIASNANFDWIELISVGIAPTKKRATQLASMDQIALWNESIGIDLTLPSSSWMTMIDDDDDDSNNKDGKDGDESFEMKYEKAQTLLELLRCSKIKYEYEAIAPRKATKKHTKLQKGQRRQKKENQSWIAEGEIYFRGKTYFSTGDKASNKKDAEQSALVNIFEQNEDLQKEADIYTTIINNSPSGKHVSSLQVSRLSNDSFRSLSNSMKSTGIPNIDIQNHNEKKNQHILLKQQYELDELRKQRNQQRTNNRRNSNSNSNSQSEQQLQLSLSVDSHYSNNEEQQLDNAAAAAADDDILRSSQSQYLLDQEQIKIDYQRANNLMEYEKMETQRKALPIHNIRDDLIDKLKTSQVIVVSGGTGSGKSTQCPQYILEDAIQNNKGSTTKILVTQPRRIAAISVSERVSQERYEKDASSDNSSVGYAVRFKSKKPRNIGGSIEFVTTGILLRRLLGDDSLLQDISHVLIDEVHERDINTDFLLILFRDLLKKRPDLKLILMSATLDAESFGEYFASNNLTTEVPVLSVPAKPRHPVEVHYLEDLLKMNDEDNYNNNIETEEEQEDDGSRSNNNHQISLRMKNFASSLLQYNDDQLRQDYEDAIYKSTKLKSSATANIDSVDIKNAIITNDNKIADLEKALATRREDTSSTSSSKKNNKIDFRVTMTGLVSEIALHLSQIETDSDRSGSILCFLPGMDEIKQCMKYIEENCSRDLRNKIQILPLHSTIPQDDQQKVFLPAKPGTIKLILSTNIAESSVTIDDVLAVVDSGLVREMNFDAQTAMNAMETNPTSKASATQRLGRAGRVAPGKCYRLYTRSNLSLMDDRPTPEIQRTALEATCLQTCSMINSSSDDDSDDNTDIIGVEDFLSRAMDPPVDGAIAFAMDRLTKLGAIAVKNNNNKNNNNIEDEVDDVIGTTISRSSSSHNKNGREYLTPLGRTLARLPLDPATGKMLVMGVVMKCLDPLLTAASCFSSRNAFHEPPAMREETKEIRRSFSDKSDVLAMVKAYDEFWGLVDDQGWGAAKDWAYRNSVSIQAMASIKAVRTQLLNELRKVRLIPDDDFIRNSNRRQRSGELRLDASVNANADCELLTSAIHNVGFPENLASRKRMGGQFGTVRTSRDDNAGLHPSSVLFQRKPPSDNYNNGRRSPRLPDWYLYRDKVLTSQLFLRSCSAMTPEQILLFGGYNLDTTILEPTNDYILAEEGSSSDDEDSLLPSSSSSSLSPSNSRIRGILDGWIAIESNNAENSVDLLIRARENLDMIFERKIMFPNNNNNSNNQLNASDDDDIINGIREVYDDLASDQDRRAQNDHDTARPRKSSPADFHDYFLENKLDEVLS